MVVSFHFFRPPLYPAILSLLVDDGSSTHLSHRMLSPLLGLLTVLFTYLVNPSLPHSQSPNQTSNRLLRDVSRL